MLICGVVLHHILKNDHNVNNIHIAKKYLYLNNSISSSM